MNCSRCGFLLYDEDRAIGIHLHCIRTADNFPDGWGHMNKIWCDMFHRGIEIKRVDDFHDTY